MIADHLLQDLEQLWKELAAGQPEGVARAAAMTLVVLADMEEAPEKAASEIAGVMRQHPNRSIVVRLSGGGGRLEGNVLADCWRPFGSHEQICSERIELQAASVEGLAPVLVALSAPDLPVVVWSRSPATFGLAEQIAPAIGSAGLIVNSDQCVQPDFRRLRACAIRVADLSWTVISPERDRIAEAFDDSAVMAELESIDGVVVWHSGASVPASAIYSAAWVRNVLGRAVAVRFEGGASPAIELRAGPRVVARAERGSPDRSEAALLNEELSIQGRDAQFEAALERAAELAGST